MDFITCNIGNLVTHTKERRGRREKALPPINSMNRGKLTFRTAYALYQTNDQTRLPTRCCFIQGKRMTEIEPVLESGKKKDSLSEMTGEAIDRNLKRTSDEDFVCHFLIYMSCVSLRYLVAGLIRFYGSPAAWFLIRGDAAQTLLL